LQRELQLQRSTQQLLEQSYYDNYDSTNSKEVDLNSFYRQSASTKLTSSSYAKQQQQQQQQQLQPHHITNLNNFNYHSGNHHTNYNTINQTSARDILYELKQYERFASNDNRQSSLNQLNFNNSYISDRHHSNSFNGTNYSQNIINYNNSYYKINNINNYNCIKSQLSPRDRSSSDSQRHQESYQLNSSSYHNNVKMERDETFVESSQLMSKTTTETNGKPKVVRNVTSIPPPYNNMDEEDEYNHHQNHNQQQRHPPQQTSNTHPIYRSQHFTQVGVVTCCCVLFVERIL
jgi:hypothetical protein